MFENRTGVARSKHTAHKFRDAIERFLVNQPHTIIQNLTPATRNDSEGITLK